MRPTRGVPVLPPALLHRLIVLAGARTRIARLGVPIALEKEAEAVVAPVVAARNGDIDRRPARHETALGLVVQHRDRKSTRLNSSHANISYAVFCLKKKKPTNSDPPNSAAAAAEPVSFRTMSIPLRCTKLNTPIYSERRPIRISPLIRIRTPSISAP